MSYDQTAANLIRELNRAKAELETVTSHLADAQEIIQRQMKEKARLGRKIKPLH